MKRDTCFTPHKSLFFLHSAKFVNPFLSLFNLVGNGNVHMWIKNETTSVNEFFFFCTGAIRFAH